MSTPEYQLLNTVHEYSVNLTLGSIECYLFLSMAVNFIKELFKGRTPFLSIVSFQMEDLYYERPLSHKVLWVS